MLIISEQLVRDDPGRAEERATFERWTTGKSPSIKEDITIKREREREREREQKKVEIKLLIGKPKCCLAWNTSTFR
jgi:hypothetical protein